MTYVERHTDPPPGTARVECPECGQTMGVVSRPEAVWAALHNHTCNNTPRPPPGTARVECPECGQTMGVVSRPEAVWAALHNHTCNNTPRGNTTMTAQPLKSVPDVPKRPHPRDLVAHDDPRIARAAKKVLDAVAALDEAWKANAAKAELRARQRQLEAELAAIKAQIKSGAPAPVDSKAVRAWAKANGVDCPDAGIVPKRVVEAWKAAQT